MYFLNKILILIIFMLTTACGGGGDDKTPIAPIGEVVGGSDPTGKRPNNEDSETTIPTSCGVDLFLDGDSCVEVAVGEYSADDDTIKSACNNTGPNINTVTYTSAGGGSNNCDFVVDSCVSGNHTEDNLTCVSNTRSCTISNGIGTQTWDGSQWGSCDLVSCDSGFHTEDNLTCVSDTRSCVIDNGTGEELWDGSSWGSCNVVSCDSGYRENDSGQCLEEEIIFSKSIDQMLSFDDRIIATLKNGNMLKLDNSFNETDLNTGGSISKFHTKKTGYDKDVNFIYEENNNRLLFSTFDGFSNYISEYNFLNDSINVNSYSSYLINPFFHSGEYIISGIDRDITIFGGSFITKLNSANIYAGGSDYVRWIKVDGTGNILYSATSFSETEKDIYIHDQGMGSAFALGYDIDDSTMPIDIGARTYYVSDYQNEYSLAYIGSGGTYDANKDFNGDNSDPDYVSDFYKFNDQLFLKAFEGFSIQEFKLFRTTDGDNLTTHEVLGNLADENDKNNIQYQEYNNKLYILVKGGDGNHKLASIDSLDNVTIIKNDIIDDNPVLKASDHGIFLKHFDGTNWVISRVNNDDIGITNIYSGMITQNSTMTPHKDYMIIHGDPLSNSKALLINLSN